MKRVFETAESEAVRNFTLSGSVSRAKSCTVHCRRQL